MSDIQKDFLILSYNEGAKNFTMIDLNEVLNKIQTENPAFIFVCTQESATYGTSHYQHILDGKLIEKDYLRLLKADTSKPTRPGFLKTSTNVRTRIYYKKAVVVYNIYGELEDGKYLSDVTNYAKAKVLASRIDAKKKYIIRTIGFTTSKYLGLGKLSTGSIFTRLKIECIQSKKIIQLIVINSHLYFSPDSPDTGLLQRKTEFLSLLDGFGLPELYTKKSNIFFCGNLNFRLSKKYTTANNTSNSISAGIINHFKENPNLRITEKQLERLSAITNGIVNNHPEKTKVLSESPLIITNAMTNSVRTNDVHPENQLVINRPVVNNINKNELYKIINNLIKSNNKSKPDLIKLLEELYKNAKMFGIHLTYKIHQNSVTTYPSFYKSTPRNGMFNRSQIPSMCDKILVANHGDILIKKEDFKVLQEMKKSDHFMISLSGVFNSLP
jgi:hypothetical protein